MSVDVESLSMPDFLALLRYEGNPPPGPEFDAIRMTPQEWGELFPGTVQHEGGDRREPAAVPAAEAAPAAH